MYKRFQGIDQIINQEAITNKQICEYRTTRVGHLRQGDLGGTPVLPFDVCNEITIPQQKVDLYLIY
jgi:hypothetical protein